jgi:hypothetical protein
MRLIPPILHEVIGKLVQAFAKGGPGFFPLVNCGRLRLVVPFGDW